MGVRKHSNLLNYAVGNLIKHRTKSTALIAALVISTSLLCSVEFIREGVRADFTLSQDEGPDIILQKLIAGRHSLVPTDWRSNASAIDGVRAVLPRVWGYTDIGGSRLLTIMGVNASEYADMPNTVGTEIVGEGTFLQNSSSREIVVGQGIIDIMRSAHTSIQVGVGSKLHLIAYDNSLIEFEIIGVFSSESKIYSYDLILTHIQSARDLFGISNDTCNDLAIWTSAGANVNSVAFQLDNMWGEARVLTKDAMRDLGLQAYSTRAGISALMWAMILLIVVLLAFTVSSSGSDEARREVGLLKALGFDTTTVLEIRMLENLVIGLLGCSLGVSASIIYCYFLGAPILSNYLLGWSLALLNGGIPLRILPSTIFAVFAAGLVPILVASVIPAWRNAITDPDNVLRGV